MNPASPPITLVPGWGLGRGPLAGLAQTLGAGIIDLPGWNGTPAIEEFSAAADQLALQAPAGTRLIGWSLGGMLSMAAAARHPERIAGLVLIAGTASFVTREEWPDAMPAQQLEEFTASVLDDFSGLLPRFVGNFNRGDHRAKTITRALLEQTDPAPPQAVLASTLGWLREVDLRPLLPAVRCPVLIVQGALDPLMPLAGAEALARRLPNARLEIMPQAAHTPFLSDPDDFLGRLRSFL